MASTGNYWSRACEPSECSSPHDAATYADHRHHWSRTFQDHTRSVSYRLIVVCLLIGFSSLSRASAQTRNGAAPLQRSPETTDLQQRVNDIEAQSRNLTALERRVERLETQLASEIKAAETRFTAVTSATERTFTVFYVMGALGSVLAGVVLLHSVGRERQARSDYLEERQHHESQQRAVHEQQYKDYKTERRFYEERATAYERRERASQDYMLALNRKATGRELRLLDQQIRGGEAALSASTDMVKERLEAMADLGAVIRLVQDTFKLELTKSREDLDERRRRQEADRMLSAFGEFFRNQYTRVYEIMNTFRKHTAMDWSRLTDEEATLAGRARILFEGVPEFVQKERREANQWDFARLCQLLGVSAFYSNDIESAIRLLEASREIYVTHEVPPDEIPPFGYCSHFRGIIDKTWRPIGRDAVLHLNEATKYFESSRQVFKNTTRAYLPTVTLCEVLSYYPDVSTRQEGERILSDAITDIDNLREAKGLDKNQSGLLSRAFLLMGNIKVLSQELEEAVKWYSRGSKHDPDNAFFELSIAAIATTDADRRARFKEGLSRLQKSQALAKRETATLLIGLFWAVVASVEAGDHEQVTSYTQKFTSTGEKVREVFGREPLVFCPTTKGLMRYADLAHELDLYVARSKSA
jgi:hypothetical protein